MYGGWRGWRLSLVHPLLQEISTELKHFLLNEKNLVRCLAESWDFSLSPSPTHVVQSETILTRTFFSEMNIV